MTASLAEPAPAGLPLMLAGTALTACPSGALWWADARLLAVADLHLGRAERTARHGGALLPPYACADTLLRLEAEVARLAPAHLLCLGDSFDDGEAARRLSPDLAARIARLAAGRQLTWIAGNHDPRPPGLPGEARAEARIGPLAFRHIAAPEAGAGEISGHYHPKARLALRGQRIARPCFLSDGMRLILPAFGTYTGGLDAAAPAFDPLFGGQAQALLTGQPMVALPRSGLAR
ncbi:ligase-associated DNA damage response endonuclease PdeM [Paralimibaculum aggregatum]|uniref:Ligase-associated DNA damage response endonuclease PdeM n=1 Tax=Paralimibaculum aggregatum TaxID=3036245 RepID=A0ABQ6LP78_9RHOB|nr:ligase-associated DNA damage response endonuclease PdeM [Limibaculum sp. NKW23]GMG83068.1 ligase-associated DNA damage response endonuclease PdeM [Limibaculum sp. NKW23]